MKIKSVFILLLFASVASVSSAQTVDSDQLLLDMVAKQSAELHMTDTLMLGDSAIVFCDTMWKHYPHPLCVPLMYMPEVFPDFLDTINEPYSIRSIRRNALRYITRNHADMFVSISDPSRLDKLELGKTKIHRAVIKDEVDRLTRNRAVKNLSSPWTKQADVSLQITQNYATNNWYQGAVNAFAMIAGAKANLNYVKENISWENFAEWRVGVSTVSGDTFRIMNTTDDRFQISSKFGYQVHKKWYVSTFIDFKTTLFPSFQKNSNRLNTTFLTPIRYSMGAGVDCKILEGLNINLSPVTYKMVYAFVSDPERITVADFGLEPQQTLLNEVGSSLQLNWLWKPLREIELEMKFYFFTNYKQIETDLEIDVDFYINKYMSARVLLHPRYDGTIDKVNEQKSVLQFKELISVGFAHTFR